VADVCLAALAAPGSFGPRELFPAPDRAVNSLIGTQPPAGAKLYYDASAHSPCPAVYAALEATHEPSFFGSSGPGAAADTGDATKTQIVDGAQVLVLARTSRPEASILGATGGSLGAVCNAIYAPWWAAMGNAGERARLWPTTTAAASFASAVAVQTAAAYLQRSEAAARQAAGFDSDSNAGTPNGSLPSRRGVAAVKYSIETLTPNTNAAPEVEFDEPSARVLHVAMQDVAAQFAIPARTP
jgi:hypothetical protein